jgi:flagellar protein FliO/FliZ
MIFSAKTFVPDENGEIAAMPDSSQEAIFSGAETANNLPPGDYGMTFVKMFLTMIVLVVLFGLTIWFLRRLIRSRIEKGSGEQMIEILEKKMISPKTMLYVVEIEGKRILLAESQLEVRPISEIENCDLSDEIKERDS